MTKLNNRVATLEKQTASGRGVRFIMTEAGETDGQAMERLGVMPRAGDVLLVMRLGATK